MKGIYLKLLYSPGSAAPEDIFLGPKARRARERRNGGEQEGCEGSGCHSVDGVVAGGAEDDDEEEQVEEQGRQEGRGSGL